VKIFCNWFCSGIKCQSTTYSLLFLQNGERVLKAGTVEAIVRYLTPEESSDGKHLREFLLTYNYYTTASEVLEILFERFRKNLVPTVPGQPAIIPLRCAINLPLSVIFLLRNIILITVM